MPNALPSVTSIPNYSVRYHYAPYFNGSYGNGNYGNGNYSRRSFRDGRYGYVIPYYYPVDSSQYGYDYVGGGAGPDMYSGPPVGPNDPSMHMVVEQPPAQPYADYRPPDMQAYAPPMRPPDPPAPPVADVKPGDPTVLVFRSGHQQEVTNYAIMGDSLYVFDQGRKKIALSDLDLAATVKANDDRGVQFALPAGMSPNKNGTTVPKNSPPDSTPLPPPNVASAMP
jgi:hypothetical protein